VHSRSITRKRQLNHWLTTTVRDTVAPHELAEKFIDYFESVFTVQDTLSLSSANELLSGVSTTKLLQIVVNEKIVKKKLDKMRWDNAGGADD